MASYDRQFEIIRPTLDRVVRAAHPIADAALLDPTNASSLIDGEFVQFNASYQLKRGDTPTQLSYAAIDDRGDTGVQAHKKLSIVQCGGYEANTLVFHTGLTTLGAPVMLGTVNNAATGSVNRAGLIAWVTADPQNLIIGYVTRVASANGGRLRFQQTLV